MTEIDEGVLGLRAKCAAKAIATQWMMEQEYTDFHGKRVTLSRKEASEWAEKRWPDFLPQAYAAVDALEKLNNTNEACWKVALGYEAISPLCPHEIKSTSIRAVGGKAHILANTDHGQYLWRHGASEWEKVERNAGSNEA